MARSTESGPLPPMVQVSKADRAAFEERMRDQPSTHCYSHIIHQTAMPISSRDPFADTGAKAAFPVQHGNTPAPPPSKLPTMHALELVANAQARMMGARENYLACLAHLRDLSPMDSRFASVSNDLVNLTSTYCTLAQELIDYAASAGVGPR